MILNAPSFNTQMIGMASMGSGMNMLLAMQQQLCTMMMGLLSQLFGSGLGGGLMNGGVMLPSMPGFGGGGPGNGLGGGLSNFLGGGMPGVSYGGGGKGGGGNGISGTRAGGRSNSGTPAQPGGSSKFNVGSFNVLGSSHTAAGGNKPGLASGVDRMRGAVAAMKKHNIDVAGMQEFQGDQQKAFKRLAPDFGVVGTNDNAIVYNKKKFSLVKKDSFKIPYFEGHMKEMPIALLQDKATGKKMWVVNIHNPADTKDHPHNGKNRARAIGIEQRLMKKLQATGYPVIFTGDFNARSGVDQSMGQAGMDSAAPNKARSEIDYIFGSNGVNFSNYTADHSTQANRSSDHPLIVSTATI